MEWKCAAIADWSKSAGASIRIRPQKSFFLSFYPPRGYPNLFLLFLFDLLRLLQFCPCFVLRSITHAFDPSIALIGPSKTEMGGHRLSHRYWISVLLFLLLPLGFFGSAQQMMDLPLEDHGSEHHSRHHSLLGPCLDRGQYCDKLKRFCNDFKYQTLVNKECRATCGRC